jgi:preprotein translocase subunit SecG
VFGFLIYFIYIVVCFLLVLVILMQSSKGGGLAGTFGGQGTSAIFGGRGAATFLAKLTAGLAIIFMVFAIFINITIRFKGKTESVVKKEAVARQITPASSLPKPKGVNISSEEDFPVPVPPAQEEENQ